MSDSIDQPTPLQPLLNAQYLPQERETFYQIFEQTPAAICIQRGPEHRYEYYNAAYQQFFPDRQLQGRPVAEALPETVKAGFVALLDGVYQTGQTYFGHESPLLLEQPGGSPPKEMYFTFTYQAYRETGQIVGISTFAYEVTEQVLLRRQREAQQQELRELFEQAPVAIAVLRNPEYLIEIANPLMATLWGRTPNQVLGRPLFEALPEVRHQGFRELLDEVVQTGMPHVASEVETLLQRNGRLEKVYLNFVYHPLKDEHGLITSVAAVATNVSEQVAARQQLAQTNQELTASIVELDKANQQLRHTNSDLDNFIYTASHDLRSPIINIEALMGLVKDELAESNCLSGNTEQVLQRVTNSVSRLKRTIQDLTEISQLQKDISENPAEEIINVQEVYAEIREDLGYLSKQKACFIQTDFQAYQLSFSRKNFRSILYNLLSNAVKYQSPERDCIIQLRTRLEGPYVVLTVKDNGLGIHERYQEHLYTMFRRFHDHVEGTGVGLYMVKRIVENAGGKIEIVSQEGAGTEFKVYFKAAI
jgi:PAS domain S-box-containing protein